MGEMDTRHESNKDTRAVRSLPVSPFLLFPFSPLGKPRGRYPSAGVYSSPLRRMTSSFLILRVRSPHSHTSSPENPIFSPVITVKITMRRINLGIAGRTSPAFRNKYQIKRDP